MRDSVPSARYSSVCNVLRQRSILLIPTYRVRGGSRIDCRGGGGGGLYKYTARVSAREILCATPTFDVFPHTTCYTKKK